MPEFQSLPGFRDFYPAEFAVRAHIANAWRDTARRYAFEEYDGPPLEPLELYTEKSGDEIVGQLYNFKDKGGRDVAMRPEMTPTLARMIGARAGGMAKPIRWFSIPQLFRYERTQRGRLREHFQWNVDILGEEDVAADAEVLSVALDALGALGLTSNDIVARISDRILIEKLVLALGVKDRYLPGVYAAVDKIDRMDETKFRLFLQQEAALLPDDLDRVIRFFRTDFHSVEALADEFKEKLPTIGKDLERLKTLFRYLDDAGFGEFVRFDQRIVRGLAYYTGTVFEIFDRKGHLRAVCGGGRYNNLLERIGGQSLPAVGFGMGDVVLADLLRDRQLLPQTQRRIDWFVVAITEADRPFIRRAAQALRGQQQSAAYSLKHTTVSKQFKDARSQGAERVLVMGPDERAAGRGIVRNMESGEEVVVDLSELGIA